MAMRLRAPKAARWTPRNGRVIVLSDAALKNFAAQPKLARIVETLGLSAAADVLDVDKSQLRRCVHGDEGISAELTRRISDLEFVLDRALQVMNPEEVGPWLANPEPLLGNSVPMNVLTLSGPSRVIGALDAIGAGTFA